jgi:multiple sugar transport system substrate-binding protein
MAAGCWLLVVNWVLKGSGVMDVYGMSVIGKAPAPQRPRRVTMAALLGLGWMGCAGLVGLTGLMSPTAAAAAQKTTITVATFPDLDRAAKAAVPVWNKAYPHVEVKIVSLQYSDHHVAMQTALATGSNLPDVMALDLRFVAKFAEAGALEDLSKPPYTGAALRDKFVRYSIAQATRSSGELSAIPTDIGPGTLLYRKDILDKAGVKETDLTGGWESYIAAGKKIKAATGTYLISDASEVRDIVMRTGIPAGEGLYFDAKGNCLVESPRFVKAFELARLVRQQGLDAKVSPWTNEWTASFKRNQIATQMMGAWLTGHLKNWLAPQTAGQWRSAGLPGGQYGSYGGSFYAIPAKATHKKEAWNFIVFMTANKATQLNSLQVLDSFPAWVEAHQDPAMDEPVQFLGGQKARQLWRDIAAKVPPIPVNKHDNMATEVIKVEFENVVSQGKDIRAALADARRQIERKARR